MDHRRLGCDDGANWGTKFKLTHYPGSSEHCPIFSALNPYRLRAAPMEHRWVRLSRKLKCRLQTVVDRPIVSVRLNHKRRAPLALGSVAKRPVRHGNVAALNVLDCSRLSRKIGSK